MVVNKRAIFTIVTKNYIGIATILGNSIKSFHPDVDYFVFISDELGQGVSFPEDQNITYLQANKSLNIEEDTWYDMAFKYTLVELCTAIKPFCFSEILIRRGYDTAIYLDPDILLFNTLDDIFERLGSFNVVLTPHIVTCDPQYNATLSENEFLNAGVYNCGFVGISSGEKALNFIKWWEERLKNRCYSTPEEGLFTDQKWINFVSCFFDHDEYYVERSLAYNIAPWNYFEREIIEESGIFFVRNRITKQDKVKVSFVHYSGYDYKAIDSSISRYFNSIDSYDDLNILLIIYQRELDNPVLNKYLDLPYSYSTFSNGVIIGNIQRRLYRRLKIENVVIDSPFSEKGSFYKQLKNAKLLYFTQDRYDKVRFTNENALAFANKILIINKIFGIVFGIIGVKKFSLLIKFFSKYFRYENFIFLYDKTFDKTSFNKDFLK